MSTLLRLDKVGRDFGAIRAVHGLSIDVAAGSCHALIGPNGAGKTTVLNLIAGTVHPTSGTISLGGQDITNLPMHLRARHGIGRTWQHPAVCARLTVAQNLTLACTHHDHTSALRRRRRTQQAHVDRALDAAGLREHATVPAAQLPYGLQRRLELAMATMNRPRLLLLDEPSAGLDPDALASLSDQIKAMRDQQITVLLVDHHLDLVWSLADTVTVLHHGRHLATGTPAQVRADPHVQAAYLSTGQPTTTPRHHPSTSPATGTCALSVTDLRAGHHRPVLDGITFEVAAGETLAVLGRNGSGKTTLLYTIAGLLPARGGHLELAGRPLTGLPPHRRARAGLALVPQGRRLFGPLTVTEHLICAHAARRSRSNRPDGPQWTIERVFALLPALAARAYHPARLLSGGEQQMLALARALMTNPRLLLLDEPSEGLAPAVTTQLGTVLADLTAHGLAVLIAEQNVGLATALADRLLLLHAGRVATTCTVQELSMPANRNRLHTLLGIADHCSEAMTPDRRSRTPQGGKS